MFSEGRGLGPAKDEQSVDVEAYPESGCDYTSSDTGDSRGRDITRDMILRSIEHQTIPGARKALMLKDYNSEEKLLAKQTHLHLNGQGIRRICNLSLLDKLENLYLYDNYISRIENLNRLKNLKYLYLNNNNISQISGLETLTSLQKLYLQHNCISIITGLQNCASLEELHVSNQCLPAGVSLQFDPSSMAAISLSLRLLNAPQCGINAATVGQLYGLVQLRKLDISQNEIADLEALETALQPCQRLQSLILKGNPISKAPKYRDNVVIMCDSLMELDGETITDKQREFILRFHLHKMKNSMAQPPPPQAQGQGQGPGQPQVGGGEVIGPAAVSHGGGFAHEPGRLPPRTGGFDNSSHRAQQASQQQSFNRGKGQDLSMEGQSLKS